MTSQNPNSVDSPEERTARSAPSSTSGSALHEQSARDRASLAAALDPILTIDAKGCIQSASDSVERLLGWTPAELIGQNVNILMPEPAHSAHDGYLERYALTGQTSILNRARRFDAMRKDGSRVPIELCVSRAEMSGGGGPLFVGILRDMSEYAAVERSRDQERARWQQQLAEQTSALQEANLRLRMTDRIAALGTLAAGLGHDMSNVLLPVMAHLSALRASGRAGGIASADRKHVDYISKSLTYLQQLADGLHYLVLDPDTESIVRGSGAGTDIEQWWSRVGVLLSKAVPKHARVTTAFAAHLPRVAVAAHALTQAVLNLVVNAGEAIRQSRELQDHAGEVRIHAEASDQHEGSLVHIAVSDNGLGMSDEIKARAFEMFYTTKPRGMGTGLGLALVRRVAEHAGGRVEIESRRGEGTTVHMYLPAAQARDSGAPRVDLRATLSVRCGRGADLVRHVLESMGCVVQCEDPADSDIWVVDPSVVSAREAREWHQSVRDGRLVLFGQPLTSVATWNALNPITIDATSDYNAIRNGLYAALGLGKEVTPYG